MDPFELDRAVVPPVDDVDAQAQLALNTLDKKSLLTTSIAFAIGLIVSCGGDLTLNLLALGSRFIGELNEQGDARFIYGTTFITLGSFVLTGALYGAGKHRAACVGYGLLLGLLGLLLLPVFETLIGESLGAAGTTSFGSNTVTARTWLFWPFVVLLTIGFSVAGLCVCGCEFMLADCWKRWKMRWEAEATLRIRSKARAQIALRDGLRELLKLDVITTADGWTREVLMEYRRGLEAHYTELGEISGDGRYSRDRRHKAYEQRAQAKNVINSLAEAEGGGK